MNIVRELITVLSYRVDEAGYRRYEQQVRGIKQGTANLNTKLHVDTTELQQARSMVQGLRRMMGGNWQIRPGMQPPGSTPGPSPALPATPLPGQGAGGRVPLLAAGIAGGIGGLVANMTFNALDSAKEAVRSFFTAGDAMLSDMQKLNGALGERKDESQQFYDMFYANSMKTGVAVDKSVNAFGRYAVAARELGKPLEDAATLTMGLQKAFILNGNSTQEAASVMMQLGQALTKGTFNDDEFKSFMENGGALVEDFRKSLVGLIPGYDGSTKKLRELSTAGKLTSDVVFPAMLKALERTNDAFDKMPITAGRGFAILKVVAMRFAADLNNILNASNTVGRTFKWVADAIEWLRKGLPTLKDWIDQLGGIERITRFVGFALLAAFGPSLIAMLTRIALWFSGAVTMMAPWIIAIGLAAAAFEELYLWITASGDTLLEDWLGPFDKFKAALNEVFGEERKDPFEVFKDNPSLASAIQSFRDMKDSALAVWEQLKPIREWFATALPSLNTDYIKTSFAEAKVILDGVRAALGWISDSWNRVSSAWSGRLADNGQSQAANLWNGLINGPPKTMNQSRVVGGPANTNSTTVKVEQPITITGVPGDPSAIAGAAQRGVNAANDRTFNRNALGRALQNGATRTEASPN